MSQYAHNHSYSQAEYKWACTKRNGGPDCPLLSPPSFVSSIRTRLSKEETIQAGIQPGDILEFELQARYQGSADTVQPFVAATVREQCAQETSSTLLF